MLINTTRGPTREQIEYRRHVKLRRRIRDARRTDELPAKTKIKDYKDVTC